MIAAVFMCGLEPLRVAEGIGHPPANNVVLVDDAETKSGGPNHPGGAPAMASSAAIDRVLVQPPASQFAPPYRPDVNAAAARDIDELYRELTGSFPPLSSHPDR
jgi:hypothetical protein